MVHNAASVGNIGMNYLRYGDEVRITPALFESFFLVQIPLSGTARIRVGDDVLVSNRRFASLPSPVMPVDMTWSADCEQLIVHIPRAAVEAAAGNGTEPVVFHPLVDMDSPAMTSWMRLVRLACDEADQATGILSSPIAATHFEQVIISGLLSAQPNSTTQSPRSDTVTHTSRAVRLALALIEQNPETPWRIADLAEQSGVSARTLQSAFARERGTTPLEELRRVRLQRAHEDLRDSGPEATTVTDVAARWGFFHFGRFSSTYRAEFGESPSHTLAS